MPCEVENEEFRTHLQMCKSTRCGCSTVARNLIRWSRRCPILPKAIVKRFPKIALHSQVADILASGESWFSYRIRDGGNMFVAGCEVCEGIDGNGFSLLTKSQCQMCHLKKHGPRLFDKLVTDGLHVCK
jgi:hypothetical protein